MIDQDPYQQSIGDNELILDKVVLIIKDVYETGYVGIQTFRTVTCRDTTLIPGHLTGDRTTMSPWTRDVLTDLDGFTVDPLAICPIRFKLCTLVSTSTPQKG